MPCARRSDAISIAYSAEKVQFSPTIARASSGPLYGVHSATTTVFAAMTAMKKVFHSVEVTTAWLLFRSSRSAVDSGPRPTARSRAAQAFASGLSLPSFIGLPLRIRAESRAFARRRLRSTISCSYIPVYESPSTAISRLAMIHIPKTTRSMK